MTNPFKPISRVNLHSEVMQQITAAIQSGQWKPGSKLPGKSRWPRCFRFSRTCIREVLKALAYSGVVESRSGVGTFVRGSLRSALPAVDLLSSTDYTQILEMRKLLEGQAAYWATERATPEEIAELESILKQEGLSLKDIHTSVPQRRHRPLEKSHPHSYAGRISGTVQKTARVEFRHPPR